MLELLGGDPEFYEQSSLDFPVALEALGSAGFREVDGCIVPQTFSTDTIWSSTRPVVDNIEDQTGFECSLSKVHVDSFVAKETSLSELARLGLDFAWHLRKGLNESKMKGPLRVIVSARAADSESSVGAGCTVRFHRVRAGQVWLSDDLEAYKEEAIAVLDF